MGIHSTKSLGVQALGCGFCVQMSYVISYKEEEGSLLPLWEVGAEASRTVGLDSWTHGGIYLVLWGCTSHWIPIIHFCKFLHHLVSNTELEPTTLRLTVSCSINWASLASGWGRQRLQFGISALAVATLSVAWRTRMASGEQGPSGLKLRRSWVLPRWGLWLSAATSSTKSACWTAPRYL